MKQQDMCIISNKHLNGVLYEMVLQGECKGMLPGQFINISIENYFLRRPISICDASDTTVTIVYKVVGEGTKAMSSLKHGAMLNVITHLGNGFNVKAKRPLLVGGGVGSAPLYMLAKAYNKIGITPIIILGFRNEDEIFYKDKFSEVGNLIITTDDGSVGYKGNAVQYLKENQIEFDKYYACGPMVMFKYLQQYSDNGYMSLEARMGCGFGVCMGCSIQTTEGNKRVCKEGPVFDAKILEF